MSRTARRRVLTGTGLTAALVGVAVSSSIAYAAVGDGPVVYACTTSAGAVRLVLSTTTCKTGERKISWNKQGPTGLRGATGATGPRGATGLTGPTGATGVPGPTGESGATGLTGPQGPAGATSKPAGASGEFGVPGTVTCTGLRQGVFGGTDGSSVVHATSYGVVAPRDPATGQATGKRQHKPLNFVKSVDRTSPQYFQALVTNELLTSCTVTYFSSTDRAPVPTYRVKLVNAAVIEVAQTKGDSRIAAAGPLGEHEQISLTFQRIEIEHLESQTFASDDISSTA